MIHIISVYISIYVYKCTQKKTEQATVGVRKLQHFLCKDPTAYGATGQN